MASPVAGNGLSARNAAPLAPPVPAARWGRLLVNHADGIGNNPLIQVVSIATADLPPGFRVARLLRAVAWIDDEGVGLREPDFGLYEVGRTLDEARITFGARLVHEMQWLQARADSLSPHLARMLAWLTASIQATR